MNEFPDNGYAHWGLLEGQDIVGSEYAATSNKHTGYFWLSYYDGTINGPEAYVFEISDDKRTNNQHDYLPVVEYGEYATEAQSKMSNVFTAKETEELKEISVFTATPNTKLTFSVYVLADDAVNPEDGICVYSSEEKEYPFGGYHREDIHSENGINLCRGQKYSVVVSEKTPSGKYSISFGKSYIEPRHASDPRSFKSIINKGESFLYIDGKWRDMSDEDVLNTLLVDKDGYVWNVCADNFPIKAFTAPSSSGGAYLVVTNRNKYNIEGEITLKQKSPMPLLAQFKGATNELESYNPEITWESSDPEVLSVVKENGNDFKVKITGLKAGSVYLKVYAGKYGTRVIKVNVRKYAFTYAEFTNHNQAFVYTGSQITPKVDYISAETEEDYVSTTNLVEGTDYVVSYQNNVLCGRATASVTGIGKYQDTIENSEIINNLSFLIVPRKAEITGITQTGNKLKVAFKPQKNEGVTGYVLYYKEHGKTAVKSVKLGSTANSAEISGLTYGKTYDFYLKAYVTTFDDDAVYNAEWDLYEEGYTDHFGAASDTKQKKVVVTPAKLSKVTAAKKSFKASWKAVSDITGYQIQYSTDKSFKKNKKTVTVSKSKTTSKTVKKLKAKKKYYVRIRTYKTVSGKKYYSEWSKAKSVKTKK